MKDILICLTHERCCDPGSPCRVGVLENPPSCEVVPRLLVDPQAASVTVVVTPEPDGVRSIRISIDGAPESGRYYFGGPE